MKKIFITFQFLLGLTFISNAQSFGLMIGGNSANISESSLETTSRFNFTASIFSEVMISDKIGLQPEVMLSGQGFKFNEDTGGSIFEERKQKLSYVNVPVLLNFYLIESLYLQAGPYFGFLTNARLNVSGSLGLVGGSNDEDFENTDFGTSFGLGIKFNRSTFGIRYLLGFSNISTIEDFSNNVLNVNLGFRIIDN